MENWVKFTLGNFSAINLIQYLNSSTFAWKELGIPEIRE